MLLSSRRNASAERTCPTHVAGRCENRHRPRERRERPGDYARKIAPDRCWMRSKKARKRPRSSTTPGRRRSRALRRSGPVPRSRRRVLRARLGLARSLRAGPPYALPLPCDGSNARSIPSSTPPQRLPPTDVRCSMRPNSRLISTGSRTNRRFRPGLTQAVARGRQSCRNCGLSPKPNDSSLVCWAKGRKE